MPRNTHSLSAILDRVPDAIFVVNRNWEITSVNATGAALVGRRQPDLVGAVLWKAYPELKGTRFEVSIRNAVLSGAAATVEDYLDVYGIWAEVQAFPSGDEVTIYLRDRTERREAEEAAQFQKALLEAMDQAVIATDSSGVIKFWNRAATKLYGWKPNEVIGKNVLDLMMSEASQAQGEQIMNAVKRGKRWAGEFPCRRKDGSVFMAHVTDAPVMDERGKLVGIVGLSYDVAAASE